MNIKKNNNEREFRKNKLKEKMLSHYNLIKLVINQAFFLNCSLIYRSTFSNDPNNLK